MLWMGLEATTFNQDTLFQTCVGFQSSGQHACLFVQKLWVQVPFTACCNPVEQSSASGQLQTKNQVTVHKIIQYQPSQFQANVSFPYLLKKPRFLCSHGVQNWNIDLKWVNANKQFIFLSVVLQFLILCVGFELFIFLSFI